MDPLGEIKYLTVHCSGSPAGRGNTALDVCAWDRERFGQPSYHFVIAENGKVTACLPLTQKGAHVGGHNTGNIGICYIGGVRRDDKGNDKNCDTRTVAQRIALRSLVDTLQKQYNIPSQFVRGHRDWPGVHKDCPCFDVASQL